MQIKEMAPLRIWATRSYNGIVDCLWVIGEPILTATQVDTQIATRERA